MKTLTPAARRSTTFVARARRILYLDASAVVKLVIEEPASDSLRAFLSGGPGASCELALTEGPRAVRRAGRTERDRRRLLRLMDEALEGLTLISLDRVVLRVAAGFEHPGLRSLDAIHIASALSTGSDLQAFVSYDRRQVEAAAGAGLPVVSPGVAPT